MENGTGFESLRYIITLLLKNYLVIRLFYIGFNLIIKLLSVNL